MAYVVELIRSRNGLCGYLRAFWPGGNRVAVAPSLQNQMKLIREFKNPAATEPRDPNLRKWLMSRRSERSSILLLKKVRKRGGKWELKKKF